MYLDDFNVSYENMYNPQQKSDFIFVKFSHMEKTDIETIIRMFNVVGRFENHNKKDFSDFILREVIDLFERCEWQKANTFAHNKSILKQYIDWCIAQNKSEPTHPIYIIEQEDISGHMRFDRQYFKDFDELKKCLDDIYDNADVPDTNQFIFHKLTYCLSFLGFQKQEVRFLKKDDVNISNKSITSALTGYKVENVADYIIDLALECMNIESYASKNKFGERLVRFKINNYLIRTKVTAGREDDPVPDNYFPNINARFRSLTNKYTPFDEYYTKAITCDSVYYSGRYFAIYEKNRITPIVRTDYGIISKLSRISEAGVYNIYALNNFYDDFCQWRKYFYGF